MDKTHSGGCLCGALRYAVNAQPLRLTLCSCHFCQKMTGTPLNALAGFSAEAFTLEKGEPRSYTHISEGSGKAIYLKSCRVCSSTVYAELERFPGFVGVMAGSLDDPNWFERNPDNSRYIFAECAQVGTVFQAGIPVFEKHAMMVDGTQCDPRIFEYHHLVQP